MKENLLVDMSLDFAVDAVNICDSIKGHGSIRDQMMRSATSIGAIRRVLIKSINTVEGNN